MQINNMSRIYKSSYAKSEKFCAERGYWDDASVSSTDSQMKSSQRSID